MKPTSGIPGPADKGSSYYRLVANPFAEMHHLVSRGFQQNFSDGQKRVTLLKARSGKVIDAARPIKSNFVVPGYNTHVTQAGTADSRLEHEFAKIERPLADQIRRITPDNCGPSDRGAVASHFALHLVRSEAFQSSHQGIIEQLRRDWVRDLARDPEVLKRYEAEFGGRPSADDITSYVDQIIHDHVQANRLHVDSMVKQYNSLGSHLSKFWVQVIIADQLGVGFALADIPIVHANTKTGQYGFRDGLALGDADLIVGPLTRWTAVALSVRPTPHVTLKVKKRLQEVNAVFARAALREIACHPDDARELARVCQRLDQLPPGRPVNR
jgi:hypothetical protein